MMVLVVLLVLAFASALAWSSWPEWRLAWLMWRNRIVIDITHALIERHEAHLVADMRRVLRSDGHGNYIWDGWVPIRDAFVEDELLPVLAPHQLPLVANPASPLRWRINAVIDSEVLGRSLGRRIVETGS